MRELLEAFDEDLQFILGRPCFMFITEAQAFRSIGFDIPHKAEAEQAFFIHKMLMFYVADKETWKEAFRNYMADNVGKAVDKMKEGISNDD